MSTKISPTHRRAVRTVEPTSPQGGFLLVPRGSHTCQVRLNGVMGQELLEDLLGSLRAYSTMRETRFVLLDATDLAHMPLSAAMSLASVDQRWLREGWVVLWVGLSPYLANLILLACGGERLPSLPDLDTAWRAIEHVADLPATAARERLEAWDIMRH